MHLLASWMDDLGAFDYTPRGPTNQVYFHAFDGSGQDRWNEPVSTPGLEL